MRNSEILSTVKTTLSGLPAEWGMAPSIKEGAVVAGPINFVSRSQVQPRDVPRIAAALGATDIVVAPFLSPMTRSALDDAGVSYLDLTGNCKICINRPKLFVERHGAERDPKPQRIAACAHSKALPPRG